MVINYIVDELCMSDPVGHAESVAWRPYIRYNDKKGQGKGNFCMYWMQPSYTTYPEKTGQGSVSHGKIMEKEEE